ncbi:hypothetical protein BDE02_06G240700 [Populus trichocarpa]|nr:hypothetical protein BDE02_06G240700 [Populus trichocarpa]
MFLMVSGVTNSSNWSSVHRSRQTCEKYRVKVRFPITKMHQIPSG